MKQYSALAHSILAFKIHLCFTKDKHECEAYINPPYILVSDIFKNNFFIFSILLKQILCRTRNESRRKQANWQDAAGVFLRSRR